LTSREWQYLLDILIAAEDALLATGEMTFEQFAADRIARRAVLHCLMIIGEAAKRIEHAGAESLASLPWRDMADLRNVIVHEYEGVNMPIIWRIVREELPVVAATIAPLFPERK
jgi:uncharacterized protein with HEPN domain